MPKPERAAGPDITRLEGTTGFLIRLAQLRVYEEFHATLAPLGITPTRYSALAVIHDNPGVRPHELADALRVKRPNMATLQAQLEAEGLVERMTDGAGAGRRGVRLRLTGKGTALFARLAETVGAMDRSLTRGLTAAEHATLLRLLHRLVHY